jgi:hypothetical protein
LKSRQKKCRFTFDLEDLTHQFILRETLSLGKIECYRKKKEKSVSQYQRVLSGFVCYYSASALFLPLLPQPFLR